MATGTTLVLMKQALVTALRARPGLAGVQVLYGVDDFPEGDDHLEQESIWFGEATWPDTEIPTMRGGTKEVDETYELSWVIEVIKSDGSLQEAADLRGKALLVELQQALAENPQPSAEVLWAELKIRRHIPGQVAPGGHGARFEGVIEVRARLFP